jgi:hypothetical protein
VIYLYAIADPGVTLPEAPGFEDAPLRALGEGALVAVVSELEESVEPSEATLWEHESVVEELTGAGTILPMRFGSTLPDEGAVRTLLRERGDELADGLARVRGAVELGVRALWEPEAAELAAVTSGAAQEAAVAAEAEAGAGTTYLMRRLGHSRRSEALAERIHAPLERLARASTRRMLASPRALLIGAYLVDRGAVDDFRATAERLDEEVEEAAILCTGPWPPYSFAPAGAGA